MKTSTNVYSVSVLSDTSKKVLTFCSEVMIVRDGKTGNEAKGYQFYRYLFVHMSLNTLCFSCPRGTFFLLLMFLAKPFFINKG